ncbi:MAG: family 1 glycosylhydrolase [Oscillospiraceae bacterium]|nr:family 1 glycosylhydrolase [Oscillospiraceae bacterium]
MEERSFLTGAATAAHQVEGNNTHCDFWVMEHLKHSEYVEPSGDAVDHYNRYSEDIRLLAEAGLNAYRFSIEWARIEPEFGKYDEKEIEHYRNVISTCKENGVKPIVTLHHFSSPAWLISKGGWTDPFVISEFAKYAGYVTEKLGDALEYICTINEANMGFQLHKVMADIKNSSKKEGDVQVGVELDMKKILLSMIEQGFAFRRNPLKVSTFLRPRSKEQERIVLQAHKAAKKAIKDHNPNIKVGLTMSLFDYQPTPEGKKNAETLWNEDFGMYLPYIQDDDFLGVQNYSRKVVDEKGAREPASCARLTQMGYEDYPSSIGNVVKKVSKSFKGELIVTENGLSTSDDERRCEFIREAYQSVLSARAEGVNVIGYMYWSLLDNFEWQAGYSKTFGLIAVDRMTQKRYPKQSLTVLGDLAQK